MKAIKSPPDVYGQQALKRSKSSEMPLEKERLKFREQEVKEMRMG
jgi:hypothetical protein